MKIIINNNDKRKEMSIQSLSNEELKELAPSLFATTPYKGASEKYQFISTIDVIDEIRSNSWYPVSVSQANVRDRDKNGYQTHCVRFRHFEDLIDPQDNAVELLLFNSHDRSKSFSISAGIYRFVCANGLVVSDDIFQSYKIKHIGDKKSDIKIAIENITKIKIDLIEKISTFESTLLSRSEKESFAKSVISLRFDKHLIVDHKELLMPNRDEDKKDDIYTTLNVIQENLLSGSISGINGTTGRKFTSKDITSIAKNKEINQGIWSMAEKIMAIKSTTQALVA
jgi:hypothetical protein